MLRWKDSDVEFFVPQLAAVLMSKGVPSRNVHVSPGRARGELARGGLRDLVSARESEDPLKKVITVGWNMDVMGT